MKDNRKLWEKIIKRDPRWRELTSKGLIINFLLRLAVLGVAFFIILVVTPSKWYWLWFVIELCILMFVIYKIDQLCIERWTFAAESKVLKRKASQIIK